MRPSALNKKCIKPGDLIVISYRAVKGAEYLADARERIAAEFPGSPVVVLDSDATIEIMDHRKALARIEAKLDALLAVVVEGDGPEPPAQTLDGECAGNDRGQNQPL